MYTTIVRAISVCGLNVTIHNVHTHVYTHVHTHVYTHVHTQRGRRATSQPHTKGAPTAQDAGLRFRQRGRSRFRLPRRHVVSGDGWCGPGRWVALKLKCSQWGWMVGPMVGPVVGPMVQIGGHLHRPRYHHSPLPCPLPPRHQPRPRSQVVPK